MDKNQIALVLEDEGFKSNENLDKYYIDGYENIVIKLFYRYDTCLFNMYDCDNDIKIPTEYIKKMGIIKNKKLKTLKLRLDTNFNTSINITFISNKFAFSTSKARSYLEDALYNLHEGINSIRDVIEGFDKENDGES